jgi:hypothetical protein
MMGRPWQRGMSGARDGLDDFVSALFHATLSHILIFQNWLIFSGLGAAVDEDESDLLTA